MTFALVALSAAVLLGFANLVGWSLDKRRPMVVRVHLACGVGGAALLLAALLYRRLPLDDSGWAAPVLLGVAIVAALAARRFSSVAAVNLTLMAHMFLALIGFFVVLSLSQRF